MLRGRKVLWVVLLGTGLVIFTLSWRHDRVGENMTASQQKLPTIRLTLGDEFVVIQRQSSYRFKRPPVNKIDLIIADTPVVFEYTRPSCQFTLPPARSTSSSIDNWHATNVVVSPHLEYLAGSDALELVATLSGLFENAGWKLTRQHFSLEQVKSIFADPNTDSDYTVRVREWRCSDDELYIQIERQWTKNESLPRLAGKKEDLYVVTVKIENDKIRSMYPGR
jgi:hypothetical protein